MIKRKEETIQFYKIVAANSTNLIQSAGEKWAAIGNSAISFDLFSSQGIFYVMATAMQLRALIQLFVFADTIQQIHANQIDQIWQDYLKHKSIFYQGEQRWKTA